MCESLDNFTIDRPGCRRPCCGQSARFRDHSRWAVLTGRPAILVNRPASAWQCFRDSLFRTHFLRPAEHKKRAFLIYNRLLDLELRLGSEAPPSTADAVRELHAILDDYANQRWSA